MQKPPWCRNPEFLREGAAIQDFSTRTASWSGSEDERARKVG